MLAAYGAAAQAAGGIMQMIAAQLANQAMQRTFEREIGRQNQFQGQAFTGQEGFIPTRGVETARKQIGEGAARREKFYGEVGQASLGAGEKSTPRSRAEYQMSGQARARNAGYSDWQLMQMIAHIRQQDALNRIIDNAKSSAEVFPYRMDDAQHSQDTLSAFGGLLSSLGGGAAAFGALNRKPTAGLFGDELHPLMLDPSTLGA